MKSICIKAAGALALAGSLAMAQQPQPSIPVVNHPCQDGPKMNGAAPDTVATVLDSGFVSLFNGKNLTGWWENCAVHTADKAKGGVWFVDSSQGILYSREEGPNGGLLVTNQTYDHYEIVFDLWPVYGNDAGLWEWQLLTKAMQDEGLCEKVKVSGLGLPAEMVSYSLNGCAPQFALWSFVDLGYLTYQASYALATGAIKGEVGEEFTAGRMGTFKIEEDPGRAGAKRILMGPFTVYTKDNVEAAAN